jgi:PTH1 family peptidyl-tRNA hydrolase
MPITLVTGLGNPGSNYKESRHNIGFMVLDELAKRLSLTWKSGFQGDVSSFDAPAEIKGRKTVPSPNIRKRKVFLFKPLTFMNLSGNAVHEFCAYYKIDSESLMVVHDDLDFPFGRIKLKLGGSAAGHNGIKSVSAAVRENYYRRRIGEGGVDRALLKGYTAEYVLAPFSQKEKKLLHDYIVFAAETAEEALSNDIELAMQIINQQNAPFPSD